MTKVQGLAWDDSGLREPRDTKWAAGCRLLQTWWREERLGSVDYGPHTQAEPTRLVGSMLPLDAPAASNFLDDVVLDEVEGRLQQKGWGGLVSEDRLRRNLLSSQPLAFNLFGYLKHHPRSVIAWLEAIGVEATSIVDVRIEWAPPRDRHFGGGSAFDVAVFYEGTDGTIGLVGVECKYAEDLSAQTIDPRKPYVDKTRSGGLWRSGATERLREPRLTQLWLNTLLAQSCVEHAEEQVSSAVVVVMSCAADESAFDATVDTRMELYDPAAWLRFCSYEALLKAVESDEEVAEWADRFRGRYLDFAPVQHLIAEDDPRRQGLDEESAEQASRAALASELDEARAMAERVLFSGSIVEQLLRGHSSGPMATLDLATLTRRLHATTEDLRQIREVAATPWSLIVEDAGIDERGMGVLVAEHCLAVLGDPADWDTGGGYESLALCVIDSIWSIGIRYERVVVPLVERYRDLRRAAGADPDLDTLSDLLGIIEAAGGADGFADLLKNHNRTSSRSGVLKAQAVADAASGLLDLGIDAVDDLRSASDDLREAARVAWTSVTGQKSGISWSYLLMLTGDEGVKPDRMIRRFVADALGRGPHESTTSAEEAAAGLRAGLVELQKHRPDLTLLALDHTVWSFQSSTGRQR